LNYIFEIHFTALLHLAYMQDHLSKLLSQFMMAIYLCFCSMTTREGNMCSLLQIQSSYGVYLKRSSYFG